MQATNNTHSQKVLGTTRKAKITKIYLQISQFDCSVIKKFGCFKASLVLDKRFEIKLIIVTIISMTDLLEIMYYKFYKIN